MWRQGDVLMQRVEGLPVHARPRPDRTLALGAVTGHRHKIEEHGSATLYQRWPDLYLVVHESGARIVHPEHGPIELEPGTYRVWLQREFSEGGPVRVLD